jgi:predicted ATPase/class 3 adenylate cyclase
LAREQDGSLVSLDISGFTALSERLQARGRAGAEELVALISAIFQGLIRISEHHGGDVLKFRGDALLIFYSGDGHAARAYAATKQMQAMIGESGETMSSVGPVTLRMSSGIFTGPCQFFLVDGLHRELVVAGPAATETMRLESEATAGEILLSGPAPKGEPGPWLRPPSAAVADLEPLLPAPLRPVIALEGAEPEHRLVTAAFVKFSGVAEVIEREGLEGVRGHLEALARLVDETCAELGVTWLESDIDANAGKLYLVAGAPSSTGEDEERMLRVIRTVLDEYDGALALSAGVNRGNAFCGDVGAVSRRAYTVMGDTVNLAARLTARAEPGGILVTGDVLDRARTRYDSWSESFTVKGKELPITGYHLAGAIGVREEVASELPLIGRDAELVVIGDAVAGAVGGEQRLVELVGEPGIGKSRLVEELKHRASGLTLHLARCDAYAAATPYFALRALLRPLAGLSPELDEKAAGMQLVPWVAAVLPDLAPWLPLLAIPLGAEVPPTPETDQIDASFRRERLLDVVERFLDDVLTEPSLIVIEDMHWADDASLELLRHLVRKPAARPWLVCVTRRPGGARLVKDIPGHALLELERLEDDSAVELALAAAGELALSTEALAAVRERSGGNPLFMRALVEAARSAGSVDALPETVETVITSRIDTLEPADKLLLRNASVLGARFSLDVLSEVLEGELRDVRERARWERLGEFVAWEGGDELSFVHDLFRAVAYEGMSFRRRREVHGRAGDSLERRGTEPGLLSLHFYEAERYDQAWDYATVAGDRARAQFANVVAAELYDRALAASDHLEVPPADAARVCESLGDVAGLFVAYERAEDAYARARSLEGDSGRLLLKEGRIREQRGLYDDALEWVGRAGAAADDESTRLDVEITEAGLLFRQGRYEESVAAGKLAVEHAEAAANEAALAHACYVLDAAYTHLGSTDTTWSDRALELYDRLGDPKGLGAALNHRGIHAYYAGRWDEALDYYRRSRQAKERSGDVQGSALAMNNEAEILSDQGRYDESEKLFQDTLRVARAAGHGMIEAFVTANLGRLAARTGRFEEAHELLDVAAEKLDAIGSRGLSVERDVRLAECLVLEGRPGEALELAGRALSRAEELGRLDTLGPALERMVGYALCQEKRTPESAPHFERSLELARESDAGYEIALTLEALAATDGGHSAEAAELFERLGVIATPTVPLP